MGINDVLPYTYIMIFSLIYALIMAIVYFNQKKIMTLENIIFSLLLVVDILGLIVDILRIILPIYITGDAICLFLNKFFIIIMLVFLGLISLYIFVVTSKRNQGLVSFKENTERKYFLKTALFIFIYVSIIIIFVCILNLDATHQNYLFYQGIALDFTYASFVPHILLWVYMLLHNISKRKKYVSIFGLLVILSISGVLQIAFPTILTLSTGVTFGIAFVYFTMENPDIKMITELNKAKEEANIANANKTQFLSSMSHEIRTPLNAIVGLSQSLAEEDISENAKEEINDIIMSSESLLEIVNGILDISKIEENIIEIVPTEYLFNNLINEVTSLAKSRLENSSKPIEFSSSVSSNIPPVLYGDVGKIKEIVINFLTNAVKYTKEGFIKFNVTGEVKGENCKLTMSVIDSGIGIKEDNLKNLFTRFQRFDLENNSGIEGTGLGLSITKKMIELMGGEVKVTSEYGKGSTFTVIVDQKIVNKSLESLEADDNNTLPFDASGQTVFVVDDNKINLKVSKKLLKNYKVDIVLLNNVQECVDKLKMGEKCDLILLDEIMPESTGSSMIKIIKALPDFHSPIVAYTANAISGIREKYLEAGYDEYLAKPVEKRELRRIMKKFLKENNSYVSKDTYQQPIAVTRNNISNFQEYNNPQIVNNVISNNETYQQVNQLYNENNNSVVNNEVVNAPIAVNVPNNSQIINNEISNDKNNNLVVNNEVVNVPIAVVVPNNSQIINNEISNKQEENTVVNFQSPSDIVDIEDDTLDVSHTKEYLESNGADVNKALESLGDMETYDIAADEFVNEYENNMNKIKNAKESSDYANYAIETHGLKSNARYLGFEVLGDIAYKHELAGKESNVEFINSDYENLLLEANKVYDILKKYINN